MSRLNAPGGISSRPVNNVYTGMAFISMIVTLGALVYVFWRMLDLGIKLF
jgi:hypothetical protein